MYYTCINGTIQKSPFPFPPQKAPICVGCLSMEQFGESYAELGFSAETWEACQSAHHSSHASLEVYDKFSCCILHPLNMRHVRAPRKKLAFFIQKNRLLLVHSDPDSPAWEENVASIVQRVSNQFTLERILCSLFTHLLAGSQEILERYEKQILELEKQILDNRLDAQINRVLCQMKNDLTIRKNYFQTLLSLSDDIQDDENDLFDSDTFRYLRIFDGRVERLVSNTQLLCDSLVHVRETYQSAMDYNLNNTMKIFTVVTTVFLPLSLIVGWYGMNFTNMPELAWKYGYLAVILLCVAVVVLCFWFFKKKKLL